jgi:hypothetical protein
MENLDEARCSAGTGIGASGKPPSSPAPAPAVAMVDILVAKIDIEIGRRVTRVQLAAARARF